MMQPTLTIGNAKVYSGNNLDILPTLADNSVDSIVCDPPYELGFMGKSWDSSGIAYSVELWQECLRVLKPGGHLLAFGGTRTWHRLAVAIEDAGFEIRDNIAWLYGSGFPKSHNISKAIDKAAGAERERVPFDGGIASGGGNFGGGNSVRVNDGDKQSDIAITDDAKAWDGWGTALKPAHEPIVVARKPVIGTVAENVLTYGTGAINIDATRIASDDGFEKAWDKPISSNIGGPEATMFQKGIQREVDLSANRPVGGRWPANIILDEYTAELLDEQSGQVRSNGNLTNNKGGMQNAYVGGELVKPVFSSMYNDKGGASRFFYVAKANKRDRNEGLDELPEVRHADRNATDGVGGDNPRNRTNQAKQNFHPTVKPTALMQYLIRLVTPDNGIVLDPFTGSGSTGKAALLEGKHFIGIELTAEYLPIIEGRLTHAYNTMQQQEDDLFE